MENQNKKIENLTRLEGLYRLKVENMSIDMKYSKNSKSFKEGILNILKQKVQNC